MTLKDVQDTGGKSNIHLIGVPERDHWKNRGEGLCKKKKAEHFPKLRKHTKSKGG